jgi:hypothetical protein
MFLYFIFASRSRQNSNLNWIQINLQIIKIFEKEKEFLIPIWQWAETQLEAEPGQPLRFPPHFSTLTRPTERPSLPSGFLSVAQLAYRARPASQRTSDQLSTRHADSDPISSSSWRGFTSFRFEFDSLWVRIHLKIKWIGVLAGYMLGRNPL